MSITTFSAPGCLRCKVIKQFLDERGMAFQDHNALGEGREAFKAFYHKNRRFIRRGPDGIEFPIIAEGGVIRQGLPPVLAYLAAGPRLNGFFKTGLLHGRWVDGIYISEGDPANKQQFFEVLECLKKQGFDLQIDTNGLHAELLRETLDKGLADRLVMDVKGPLELYPVILGQAVDPEEITKSIALVASFKDHRYETTIAPVVREPGTPGKISYLTAEEVAETARLIFQAAGDNRQPYHLRPFDPKLSDDNRLKAFETMAPNALFPYRTQARRHQFKTEIVKA